MTTNHGRVLHDKNCCDPHGDISHASLRHDNTTYHYAIERICSAQNVLFKYVLRADRIAASRSPNRSVKS